MLRNDFDYGEEFSLLVEGGKLIYDVEFDGLLSAKLSDVGLIEGRTLTVVDEDEESDRVNVELLIAEEVGSDLVTPDIPHIPRRPAVAKQEPNGIENGTENGAENGAGKKRLREDEEDLEFRKKARVAVEGETDGVILIDEDDDTVMIE
jgi:hypothetical protein